MTQSQSQWDVVAVVVGMMVMLVVCKHQEWEQQRTAVHPVQHQRARSSFLGIPGMVVAAIQCLSVLVQSQSHLAPFLASHQ
jgi:hypothetical protein